MEFSRHERLEILKLEMELLQGVFDKYDTMIFTSRSWFVTLWTATVGTGLTANIQILVPIAALLAVIYWVLEGLMRFQYWHKYVVRYRAVRAAINATPPQVDQLSLYDLTHHFGTRPSARLRFRQSFGKLEPLMLYATLATGALLLWRFAPLGAGQ